jgi:hypothetical protein
MTGMHHHALLLSVEIVSHKLFCLDWPGIVIIPIPASQVARRIADVSHLHPAPDLRWGLGNFCLA